VASECQIKANRLNAQRSTGPRTADGKARVALNALKHGLTGEQAVLPNENREDFDAFQNDLMSELNPHGALEGTLAERIVIDAWRLRRVVLLESAFYRRGYQEQIIADQNLKVHRYEYTEMTKYMETNSEKIQVAEKDRQTHAEASAKLTELCSKLNDPSVEMTRVFETFAEAFANLSRHEAGISRSFSRNLHELQRLQAIRGGEQVEAPAVVDVDVNIGAAAATDMNNIF